MNVINTVIPDLYVIEPQLFIDERGYFLESFNQQKFNQTFGKTEFVQDNESKSSYGVLRGLHFQKPPYDQAKLVRCIDGKVLDVVIDIRKKSKTYGKHFKVILSSQNKKQLFIPRGFAHGFLVLSKTATFSYKVDNKYSPKHEMGLLWNDLDLNINWNIDENSVVVSTKDSKLPFFSEFKSPF